MLDGLPTDFIEGAGNCDTNEHMCPAEYKYGTSLESSYQNKIDEVYICRGKGLYMLKSVTLSQQRK